MEFAPALNHSIDGCEKPLLVISSARRILRVNQHFTDLCGWNEAEIISRFCHELIDALASNGKRLCRTVCPRILLGGGALDPLNRKVKIHGKQHKRIPVIAHHSFHDNDGRGHLVLITFAADGLPRGETDFFDHQTKLFTMLRRLSDNRGS